MKCTNCQGEWTPPANKSVSKCPFCQTDILQMLNEQAEVLSTEVILANMLQAYGTDLLQNQQRLSAMISDLFAHDNKIKRLLLLSIREYIPAQLVTLTNNSDRNTQTLAIQHRLIEDAFLQKDAAEQIVNIWTSSFGWSKEYLNNSFKIDKESEACDSKIEKKEVIAENKCELTVKSTIINKAAHEAKILNFGGLTITRTGRLVLDSERRSIQKNSFTANTISDGEIISFPADVKEEWAEMHCGLKTSCFRAFFSTHEKAISSSSFSAEMSKSILTIVGEKLEFVNPTFAELGIDRLTAMIAGKSLKVTIIEGYAQQFSDKPNPETGKYEELTIEHPLTGVQYRKLKAKKFAHYAFV
jgi:hypothetical protein